MNLGKKIRKDNLGSSIYQSKSSRRFESQIGAKSVFLLTGVSRLPTRKGRLVKGFRLKTRRQESTTVHDLTSKIGTSQTFLPEFLLCPSIHKRVWGIYRDYVFFSYNILFLVVLFFTIYRPEYKYCHIDDSRAFGSD